MPEDPGNEFEANALALLSVYLRLFWRLCRLPQVLWPLTVILGDYVTLADAQVRTLQRIL